MSDDEKKALEDTDEAAELIKSECGLAMEEINAHSYLATFSSFMIATQAMSTRLSFIFVCFIGNFIFCMHYYCCNWI